MRSDSMTRTGGEIGFARALVAAVQAFRRELERYRPSGGRRSERIRDPETGLGGELGDPREAMELLGRSQVGGRFSGPW